MDSNLKDLTKNFELFNTEKKHPTLKNSSDEELKQLLVYVENRLEK